MSIIDKVLAAVTPLESEEAKTKTLTADKAKLTKRYQETVRALHGR